jgi:hypothetical protein
MAATWHAFSANVGLASNKYMIDVLNQSTSTSTIRIYRVWMFNNHTAAVTGVLNFVSLFRSTNATGGSNITSVAHNTTNPALHAGTSVGTGRTVTASSQFRRLLMSPDEPTVSTLDWDALGTLVPFAEIWNSGYGDSNIDPVTCVASQTQGFTVQSITQTVGAADLELEYTST